MKIKVILTIVFVLFAGYFIWSSETFQREVFPEKYWSNQVKSLDYIVETEKQLIYDATLELRKKQMTMQLDVAQEVNLLKPSDTNLSEARNTAIKNRLDEIKALRDDLEISRKQLAEDEKLLEEARKQLSGLHP